MAKKSKKVSIGVDKLIYGCAAVLGLVALFLIFAPAAHMEYGLLGGTFSGTELVFGLEDSFVFSFMNFLTYLLLVAGLVLVVLRLCGVVKGKLFDLLAACLLIAAGVLFFLVATLSVPVKDSLTATVKANGTINLLVGPILAGIFSLLGGAAVLCYSLLGRK
ncbi:MAG: hypothetical protein IJ542_00805 [Clostridia bacterium]|nr:hypothetical protein [Clostridia bacterium]